MSLHLQTLPIIERWDCHQCCACCRDTTILLDQADLSRLRAQRWNEHSEFRGIRTVRRSARLAGQQVLAHKPDGSCVFLTAGGRCRIHELHGPAAKPAMCQQFPLQLVTTDRGTTATVLRSCPSAAADRGRPLDVQLADYRKLFRGKLADSPPVAPAAIARRADRSWDDFHLVADALGRLVVDLRLPLVRRLIHGLRFCALVDACKWKRIAPEAVAELVGVLEQSAPNEVGELFQDRRPPSRSTARIFRQLGAHFICCVPGGRPTRTLRDHWHAFRLSGQLARARAQVPNLHPAFPAISVDQLESPLGRLAVEVLEPLDRFFASHALSCRYVLNSSNQSLVGGYRRLAFTFPIALWMLRWLAAGREPTGDDMATIVVALERGLALPALNSAANYLAESEDLERLVAWYGR